MKYVKNVIVDADGRWFYDPGEKNGHMISLTPEDRIRLLEQRVAQLEDKVK